VDDDVGEGRFGGIGGLAGCGVHCL
jgi:hypothetical protein